MINLNGGLAAEERVVLAVDTSDLSHAKELANLAHNEGASIIKQGLELASAPGSSWEFCAENAAENNLDWVADTKGDDISKTIGGLVSNLIQLDHPPVAITMHTHSGIDAMKEAQRIASGAGVMMMGVTELTAVKERELRTQVDFIMQELGLGLLPFAIHNADEENPIVRNAIVSMRAHQAAEAGLPGLVASPKEILHPIKSRPELEGKFLMIPGTRSEGVNANDQGNVATPKQAIADGADLLVIGRQITDSDNPGKEFQRVVEEIQQGLKDRRIEE